MQMHRLMKIIFQRLLKSLNFFLSSKFDTITNTNVFHQNEILHEKMALIAKSTINSKL